MKTVRSLLFTFVVLSLYVGCSDVGFKTVPSDTCDKFNDTNGVCTVGENGINNFEINFRTGQLDLLFVVDNSGSMYAEQTQMAQRLGNLLNVINVADLDYQIAVITTDVVNQAGIFQASPAGHTVFDRNTANLENELFATIRRQETIDCENADYAQASCPSDDERGIFAVNSAIDSSANSAFFRTGAHLAVVILSDEDERSQGGENRNYPLEPYDFPSTLIAKVQTQLGSTKTLSVHAVIIEPTDSSCLSNQTFLPEDAAGPVIGRYGYTYDQLANPSNELLELGNIIPGNTGSICASNYAQQMGNIGSLLPENASAFQLPCPPVTDSLVVSSETLSDDQLEYDLDGNNLLTFNAPAGNEITVKFQCLNVF